MHENNKCLSVVGLGVGLGVTWALGVLIMGLLAWLFEWGTIFVTSLGVYYVGYAPTLFGAIIGTVWAFIDGFIGGALIAFFYNLVAKRCH